MFHRGTKENDVKVFVVKNIAGDASGGIFSTREKAEKRAKELHDELYGEHWGVNEVEVDYYCERRAGWISDINLD